MKKLFIITILLTSLQLSASSQIGTSDTLVKLPKRVAISALQDLIRYDELKIRTELLNQKISLYDGILKEKDGIIAEQKGTIGRLELITSNQDAIKKEIDLQLKNTYKQIRKQKTLKWLAIIGGVLSTGATAYFLK